MKYSVKIFCTVPIRGISDKFDTVHYIEFECEKYSLNEYGNVLTMRQDGKTTITRLAQSDHVIISPIK